MIGRGAYDDPYALVTADRALFGDDSPPPSRSDVIRSLLPHVEAWLSRGGRLHDITRHLLNLYRGQYGGRGWRRDLTVKGQRPGAGPEVLLEALEGVTT